MFVYLQWNVSNTSHKLKFTFLTMNTLISNCTYMFICVEILDLSGYKYNLEIDLLRSK